MVLDNVLEDIDRSLLRGLALEIGFPSRPSLLADVQSPQPPQSVPSRSQLRRKSVLLPSSLIMS